ncbi:MAG: arginine deiminase family protein [Desulfobacterales bacterium]
MESDLLHTLSAYGGRGWSPRKKSLREEAGRLWGRFGQSTEWAALKTVLLHRPGPELSTTQDPETVQMLARLDAEKARGQHAALARAYIQNGVEVVYVEPGETGFPNQMFVADLMFMTPEGAVLARPASTVRAGEERWIARRLADLGVPILKSIRGRGTFEGADALWIDPATVLLGRGLRTNAEGAKQVTDLLLEMSVRVIQVDLPCGTMHLMGMLRFIDRSLALAWPGRLAHTAVLALRDRGFAVHFIPDELEAIRGFALNFVTIGPRKILMPAGNPNTQAFYEDLGITCLTVDVGELIKAAGAIGCLTGIIEREPTSI